jgi:uncharacterized membrane protein YphA (DoxX/SURF4 family)
LIEWLVCLRAKEVPLTSRFSIGVATVVLLVALRVAAGWHFFSQGVEHYHDPNWSSAGFLSQAKGPWADFYQSKVPDFHGFRELVSHAWRDPQEALPSPQANSSKSSEKNEAAKQDADPSGEKPNGSTDNLPNEGNPRPAADSGSKPPADGSAKESDKTARLPTEGEPSPPPPKQKPATKRAEQQLTEELAKARPIFDAFATRVLDDWKERGQEIAAHFDFNQEQKEKVEAVFDRYKRGLVDYLGSIENDLRLYQRELRRLDQMSAFEGSSDIPYASKRLADKQRELAGKPNAWLTDIRHMEREFNEDVAAIATPEQQKRGRLAQPETTLQKTDRFLVWAMMICGGMLIVGLFTRLAALACAAFLFLVIMSQPPWVPGTITTLFPYQLIELLSLLTLATTAVGRWGGLDFFVHFLVTAPFRGQR